MKTRMKYYSLVTEYLNALRAGERWLFRNGRQWSLQLFVGWHAQGTRRGSHGPHPMHFRSYMD
jgi:hypothetical protein